MARRRNTSTAPHEDRRDWAWAWLLAIAVGIAIIWLIADTVVEEEEDYSGTIVAADDGERSNEEAPVAGSGATESPPPAEGQQRAGAQANRSEDSPRRILTLPEQDERAEQARGSQSARTEQVGRAGQQDATGGERVTGEVEAVLFTNTNELVGQRLELRDVRVSRVIDEQTVLVERTDQPEGGQVLVHLEQPSEQPPDQVSPGQVSPDQPGAGQAQPAGPAQTQLQPNQRIRLLGTLQRLDSARARELGLDAESLKILAEDSVYVSASRIAAASPMAPLPGQPQPQQQGAETPQDQPRRVSPRGQ